MKVRKNVVLIIFLIVALITFVISTNYLHKLANNLDETKVVNNKKKSKSPKIDKYIKDLNGFIEEININNEVSSIVSKENDKYVVKMFDYDSGKELKITNIIKKDKVDEFNAKINELLYLKYPKFIADVLSKNDKNNVYYLKNNELIIYYYNYEITPAVIEELSLKVNYNEIKDYLKINVTLDKEYENEDGSKIDSNKKLVAITFDDGPGAYTSHLLDILNDNKAHVTFFMLGKSLEHYKSVVKKAYDSNMEIGYHSYAHQSFKKQDINGIINDLNMSNEILKNITGTTFKLIRPPYGAINNEIKSNLNNPFILWNIDTEDWKYRDSEYLYKYTLEHIEEGSIILFHDIHKTSVDAIEKILPELYVRGYQVVTVSNLASNYNMNLDNHTTYRYFTK